MGARENAGPLPLLALATSGAIRNERRFLRIEGCMMVNLDSFTPTSVARRRYDAQSMRASMDGKGAGISSWRRGYNVASGTMSYLLGGLGTLMLLHAAHARPWMLVVLFWLWGGVAGFMLRGLIARMR